MTNDAGGTPRQERRQKPFAIHHLPAAISQTRSSLVARHFLLGGSLVLPLAAPLVWPWSPAAALGVPFATHLLTAYAVFKPGCAWLGPVVTRFDAGGRREVWLTIDDGPDPEDSPRMLDLLDQRGARATFFLVGRRARQYPALVAAIRARGHGVANHTETHSRAWFWGFGPRRVGREIDRGREALGGDGGWFRPPVGMQNPFLAPALAARGMRHAGWSARGFDGVNGHDPARAAVRVLAGVRPGAILLLHEGHRGPRGERPNVQGLELVLAGLAARGYAAVIPPAFPVAAA